MKYEYNAKIRRVVDGDTVDLTVDLGFYMSAALRFRILGVDTPELRGGTPESKAKAKLAKAFVEERLFSATRITVETQKADSFGRWLGNVTYYSPHDNFSHNLAKELIEAGHGVERLK